MKIPEIKLSYKQKVIMRVLQDEFGGEAHGPELLDLAEDAEIKEFSINQITWHLLRLREAGLVESKKNFYKGRLLNEYKIAPVVSFGGVILK